MSEAWVPALGLLAARLSVLMGHPGGEALGERCSPAEPSGPLDVSYTLRKRQQPSG